MLVVILINYLFLLENVLWNLVGTSFVKIIGQLRVLETLGLNCIRVVYKGWDSNASMISFQISLENRIGKVKL